MSKNGRSAGEEDDLADVRAGGRRAAAAAPPMSPETAARVLAACRAHRQQHRRGAA